MENDHLEHAQHVEIRRVGVFGEENDGEAQVPRVFRVIFRTATVDKFRLAKDFLQFIDLDHEGDLSTQAVGSQ
jgi:hypothetical protein